MKALTLDQFIAKHGNMLQASYVLKVPYVTLQRWRKGKTLPSKFVSELVEKVHGVSIPSRER